MLFPVNNRQNVAEYDWFKKQRLYPRLNSSTNPLLGVARWHLIIITVTLLMSCGLIKNLNSAPKVPWAAMGCLFLDLFGSTWKRGLNLKWLVNTINCNKFPQNYRESLI